MKRNQNTPQLLREHHLRRERDTALKQRAEASSNAIANLRVAQQARREAAEAHQQETLVKATKWYCNESNSDTITMSIRVPRDRWIRPQDAEMVLAHGLEQLGCAIGSEVSKLVLRAIRRGMQISSIEMSQAKRDWMMSLSSGTFMRLGYEEASRLYDTCLQSLMEEAGNRAQSAVQEKSTR